MSESIEMTLDRIRWLARQIEQTNDSGKALEWSRELRRAAVDLKNRVRRQKATAPEPPRSGPTEAGGNTLPE